MRYAVNSKSKQTWRNAHPRVLLSAVRTDLLRESGKKRRGRARSRKYRLQQIMIGAEADRWKELKARVGEGREPCVVVPIRSTWHPRAFAYISGFHSSSHVIITPVQSTCGETNGVTHCVFSRLHVFSSPFWLPGSISLLSSRSM